VTRREFIALLQNQKPFSLSSVMRWRPIVVVAKIVLCLREYGCRKIRPFELPATCEIASQKIGMKFESFYTAIRARDQSRINSIL
jgi:hypothetical protein